MSIRPVSSKLPASESVWEGLNIPMCVVVTPFDSNRLTKQATAAASEDEEDDDDDNNEAEEFAVPIAAVPKCLECGAPHPTARTHYRPSSRATHLLCYFCGATSSVLRDDQQAVRVDEWLDPATYDTTPCITPHRVVDESSSSSDEEESEDGVDVTVDDHTTQDDDESSLQTDNFEFRLPVEDYMVPNSAEDSDEDSDSSSSSSSDSDSDSDDGGKKRKKKKKKKTKKKKKKVKKKEKRKQKNKVATKKKKGWLFGRGNATDDEEEEADASPKYKVQHIWQFPAVECPPVWWIIVDGSVGGGRVRGRQGTSINSSQSSMGAVRNYWSTIGTTLLRTLADIPPHVHVGLLTASGSRLASWDLTSEVPSVKQYPYSYDPTVTAAATEEEEDPADPRARTSCWDLSLVPANRLYKANLEATIRAMVDGGTSRGVFAEETLESKHNDIIDLDEDATDQDEETADSSTGIPLGLTIEIILDFMEQAHHPGQDDIDTTDDDDDDDYTAGKKEQQMDRLRYAGGKILCLLGNPPLETAPPSNDSLSCVNQKHFYQGGLVGSCFDATEFELSQNEEATNGSKKKKKKKGGKKDGKKKKKKKDPELESDDEDDRDLTDLTASNLQDFTMALDPDGLFSKIGRRCALAALGVDLFVLVPQEDDNEEQEQHIPWYGLPLLRPLSDCSGAPGPLMFGTANANNAFAKINNDDDSDDEKREVEEEDNWLLLFENIVARTPWQDRMAFGVQMRLRLPIGFRLDSEPVELDPSMPELQLASFLTSGGLTGPASSVIDHDSDDGFLWCMGTCDSHTSFTFDLEVDPDTVNEADGVPDSCEMEDVGDVTIKPVMQTCTLFTCIETDGAEPVPNYFTVCKMRVTNTSLSLANDVESIVDGLDPEVLSAVLYQKIALDSYLDGFLNAQRTAESWLQAFMIGLYHSAQQKQAELEADTESDNDTDDGDSNDDDEEKDKEKSKSGLLSFFSRKKLPASDDSTTSSSSDSSSSSSSDDDDDESKEKHDEEIAAVAGEEKDVEDKDTKKHNEVNDDDNSDDEEEDIVTKFVVGNRLLDEEGGNLDDEEILMGGGHFKAGILPFLVYSIMQSDGLRPSRDGVYQPSMDARLCAIAQMGSMTPKAMAKSVAPFLSLWSIKDDEPIIETLPLSLAGISNAIEELGDLHDDKDGVLLLESPLQVSLFPLSSLNKIIAKGGDSTDAEEEEHQESIEVGPELESTILSGLNGFRTSPWNTYVDDGSMTVILEDIKDLVSFLLEDKPTALGDDDFNEWKSRIANLVREEVDIDDEDEEATPRGLRRFLPFGKK